jgi:hypothetical protein
MSMDKKAVAKELVRIAKSLMAGNVPDKKEVQYWMYKPQGDFFFEKKPDALYVTLYDAHDAHTVFSRGFYARFDMERISSLSEPGKYRITRKTTER